MPQLFHVIDNLLHIDPREHTTTAQDLTKWTMLGSAVGILAGAVAALFLALLSQATAARESTPALLLLLPLCGLVIGWLYHTIGGVAAGGNTLVFEELHTNGGRIPLRMTPLILFGTVAAHLFGASVGREGTAVQMGTSLADTLRRVLRLKREDRRLMIMAGVSGGFGGVFGTPLAGFVFGLEATHTGRVRYEGVIPCLSAAIAGDLTARALGAAHTHWPALPSLPLEPLMVLKVGIAAICFGLCSLVFIEMTHGVRRLSSRITYPPLRPVVGALVVIGLTLLLNTTDYLGLSMHLAQRGLTGTDISGLTFWWKLLFTAVSLGSGFVGGEVTPLFVMGATLGSAIAGPLGVEPGVLAALGFCAVFAGASNTPLACLVMGVELFGGGSIIYLGLACFTAYLASGHRSIYSAQRLAAPKSPGAQQTVGAPMSALSGSRRGWLSTLLRRKP
jgi:H+/Cl- antiporter ClcA